MKRRKRAIAPASGPVGGSRSRPSPTMGDGPAEPGKKKRSSRKAAKKAAAVAPSAVEKHGTDSGTPEEQGDKQLRDPRWDLIGFGEWLARCPCVRVGFLRRAKPGTRQQVPHDEWVRALPPGAGIDGVQLYSCLSALFGLERSPALAASELTALLQVLAKASDDDLVW